MVEFNALSKGNLIGAQPGDVRLAQFCEKNLLMHERITAYQATPAVLESWEDDHFFHGMSKARWMYRFAKNLSFYNICIHVQDESLD